MWNRTSIKPPPLCELKASLTEDDMGTWMRARSKLKHETSNQLLNDHLDVLTNEHYILSRFIYRIKNQFRREKSMSCFQQISTCLKRLHGNDIKTWIDKLTDCLDVQPSLDWSEQHVYVISQQMVEYFLVKLMGTAALLAQTGNYCRTTFVHVIRHLNVGHLIPQNVILFAATSRIWYITKSLCLKMCDWYQDVSSCLPFLPMTQVPWLPDDMVLPSNLLEWLISQGFLQTDLTIDKEMGDLISKSSNPELPSFDDNKRTCSEDIGEVLERRNPHSTDNKEPCDTGDDVNHTTQTTLNRDVLLPTNHLSNRPGVLKSTQQLESDQSCRSMKHDPCPDPETSDIKTTINSYLESSFRTPSKITSFQEQVKSMVLDINGVSVKLSKIKKKKISSLIQITLDSIPKDWKKSKRMKLFTETVIPELSCILGRLLVKTEKNK